ncbi:MAG: penicillin-binding transpeptidase domain-containing protein, partial [Bacteroidota bacterium]
MRFILWLMGALLLSGGCRQASDEQADTAFVPELIAEPAWETHFSQRAVDGCFVLQKLGSPTRKVWNIPRSERPYPPASTFKIPNSLFTLQAGAMPDAETYLPWDSVERQFEAWNQAHNLRSGIKYSVVWFYQEMARRIGAERMQQYLDTLEYGNRDISDGIDLFWLEGSLKISAQEQVSFLEKLQQKEVPFDLRHIDTVHDIMIRKQTADYTIRAKTGWALRNGADIGWLVGW